MKQPTKFYRTKVDRSLLKALSVKSNLDGLLHVALHYGIMSFVILIFLLLYSNGFLVTSCLLLFILGPLYNFLGWSGMGHELLHQTFFKSRKLNKLFLFINSLPLMNNWAYHEISHQIHHRSTLHGGIDYEFDPEQRVLAKWDLLLAITIDIKMLSRALKITILNAFNHIPGKFSERHLVWGSAERKRVVLVARMIFGFHLGSAALTIVLGIPQLFLLTTITPFLFTFPTRALTLSQHLGMPEDEYDFRLNSRSVSLPNWISWLYCNMNFHIEHHMYSSVTSHNLPKLHEALAYDLYQPMSVRELLVLVTTQQK